MKIENNINPEIEPVADKVHRLSRAALSAIPFAGSATVEILNSIIAPPVEKRRDKWAAEVTKAINFLLEEREVTLQNLQENEQFITTFLHASNIAFRTHEADKLRALKNAIVKSALPEAPESSLQQIFLGYIDMFTAVHIRALQQISGITASQKEGEVILVKLLSTSGLPEHVIKQIWQDLLSRGLVQQLHTDTFGYQVMRSPLGNQFIKFITEYELD